MKQIKRQEDQKAAEDEADKLRSALATRIIQSEGPVFWKQLIKELQITVDSLPHIGLKGTVSDIGSEIEEGYQVSVVRSTLYPDSRYINLFYKPGSNMVRMHPQEGGSGNLVFGMVDEDQLRLWYEARPMTPEKAAAAIVEPIAMRLKGR